MYVTYFKLSNIFNKKVRKSLPNGVFTKVRFTQNRVC